MLEKYSLIILQICGVENINEIGDCNENSYKCGTCAKLYRHFDVVFCYLIFYSK